MSYGFNLGGRVRKTTIAEVLQAIVAKIKLDISVFASDATCFITDRPIPSTTEPLDRLFLTVCPVDGAYDQGLMDGMGNIGTTELLVAQVTVFQELDTDQLEHFQAGLLDAETGLFSVHKPAILKCLSGKNLDGGDDGGDRTMLLLESMYPSKGRLNPYERLESHGSFSLGFDCKFDWDLGEESTLT